MSYHDLDIFRTTIFEAWKGYLLYEDVWVLPRGSHLFLWPGSNQRHLIILMDWRYCIHVAFPAKWLDTSAARCPIMWQLARNAVAVIDEIGGAATLCTDLQKNTLNSSTYICRKITDNVAHNVGLPLTFVQMKSVPPNTKPQNMLLNTKHTHPTSCKMTDNVTRNVDSASTFVQARGLLLRSHASNVDF